MTNQNSDSSSFTNWDLIESAAAYLRAKLKQPPQVCLILGSGLGEIAELVSEAQTISYTEIPGLPVSTVVGHAGQLVAGKLGNKYVLIWQGRFHYYEGYTMAQVVMPVRISALLGSKKLVVTNACGGVNPNFEVGDIMQITDHINLFPSNPLIGPNNNKYGPRFPDMSQTYSKKWLEVGKKLAEDLDIKLQQGVYAGLSGPCLETPAEYQYIYKIGADAVGMSTVPEVIAARHMGLECVGYSVITDLGVVGKIEVTTHEMVVSVARQSGAKLQKLIRSLIEAID